MRRRLPAALTLSLIGFSVLTILSPLPASSTIANAFNVYVNCPDSLALTIPQTPGSCGTNSPPGGSVAFTGSNTAGVHAIGSQAVLNLYIFGAGAAAMYWQLYDQSTHTTIVTSTTDSMTLSGSDCAHAVHFPATAIPTSGVTINQGDILQLQFDFTFTTPTGSATVCSGGSATPTGLELAVSGSTTTTTSSTTSTSTNSSTSSSSSSASSSPSTNSSTQSSSSSASTSTSGTTTGGLSTGSGGIDPFDAGIALVAILLLALLIYFLRRGGVILAGDKPTEDKPKPPPDKPEEAPGTTPPPQTPPSAPPPGPPPIVTVATSTTQETTYEVSMHTDTDPKTHQGGAGHAWADLRVTVVTKDQNGQEINRTVTETVYDFAPANSGWGDIFWGYGQLLSSTRTVANPTAPGGMEDVHYFPITKAGYDAAKAWGDARVGKGPKNPMTPSYKVLSYNCVDFTIDFVRQAGVDLPGGYAGIISTPSNLAVKVHEENHKDKQKACKHPSWTIEEEVIAAAVSGGGMVYRKKYKRCTICGWTESLKE